MIRILLLILHALWVCLRPHANVRLVNLALRQQLAVLKTKRPRPKLTTGDRIFWVILSRLWARWTDTLIIVKPETVIGWHRRGFKLFWRWNSRRGKLGRPTVHVEIRILIRQLAKDNPTWRAPRIHSELQKLGFTVSERTVSRYFPKQSPYPGSRQRWLTFLHNHHEVIASIKSMGIKVKRTAYRSPWQNGVAERWIRSCREDIINHVIVLDEAHLRRLVHDYLNYYHEDRCHLGLEKDPPVPRAVQHKPSTDAKIVALSRVGGLHHRYEWRAAA